MRNLGLSALLLVVMAATSARADEKPLWQQKSEQYQHDYEQKDYPGQERQLRAELDRARQKRLSGTQLADLLQKLGDSIFSQYRYADATPFFVEALDLREKFLPPGAVEIGKSAYSVGFCAYIAHDYLYAEQLLKESLAIFEKKFGPNNMENYAPLAALNCMYLVTVPERSRALTERMAALIKNAPKMPKEVVYGSNVQLGISRQQTGDVKGARDAYKQAVAIRSTMPAGSFPPDNLDQHLSWAEDRLFGSSPQYSDAPPGSWTPNTSPVDSPLRIPRPLSQHGTGTHIADRSPAIPPVSHTPQVPVIAYTPVVPTVHAPVLPPAERTPLPPRVRHAKALPEVPAEKSGYRYFIDGQQVSYKIYRASILTNQAGDLIEEKSYKEALNKLENALQLDPNNSSAHCAYGTVLAHLGKTDESIQALKHAIEVKPDLEAAWIALAGVYEEKGMLDEALDSYHLFLRRFPNDPMRENILSSVRLVDKERQHRQLPSKCPKMADADGVHDYIQDAERTGLLRWSREDIPISVYITPATDAAGQAKHDLIKQCLSEWSQVAPQLIAFKDVQTANDAKIKISWVGDGGLLSEVSEAGEAKVAQRDGRIFGANIVLTPIEETDKDRDARMHSTILHELGHALGLIGHSPNTADVMYFTELVSGQVPGLSERDKKTMLLLYSWKPSSSTELSQQR